MSTEIDPAGVMPRAIQKAAEFRDALVLEVGAGDGRLTFQYAAEPRSIVGIDHGLTFHPAWKLRTVIWDFAGEAVAPQLADDVCRVAVEVDGPLGERLTPLLSTLEVAPA